MNDPEADTAKIRAWCRVRNNGYACLVRLAWMYGFTDHDVGARVPHAKFLLDRMTADEIIMRMTLLEE